MTDVLLVEDDEVIAQIVTYYLDGGDRYRVTWAKTAGEALARAREPFDVILLDIMLPDVNGIDLCGELRRWNDCPVIFVSCLDDSDTIVRALERGGDDFIVKPFDNRVLDARIQANIRRARQAKPAPGAPESRLSCAGIEVDLSERIARTSDGATARLSPIECKLLETLMRNPGRHYTARELYSLVWGMDSLGDARTVMVHVHNLRRKLGQSGEAIVNEWGKGYAIVEQRGSSSVASHEKGGGAPASGSLKGPGSEGSPGPSGSSADRSSKA